MSSPGWLVLLVGVGCAPVQPVSRPTPDREPASAPVDPHAEPRRTLLAFLDAAESGAFEQVLPLLAAPLRARYDAQALARDFTADPLVRERLALLRRNAEAPLVSVGPQTLALEWARGRQVRLVAEAGGWRVAALEAFTSGTR